MTRQTISIIGAGISGLVLAQCLSKRGITTILYERDAVQQAAKRHGYGITLHPWAYRPLLRILNLDENSFRRKVAVDGAVGGTGRIGSQAQSGRHDLHEIHDASFRANRRKLEQLLSDGLDVRWGHELSEVTTKAGTGSRLSLDFTNGQQLETNIVVSADGPHSKVRKSILPEGRLQYFAICSLQW